MSVVLMYHGLYEGEDTSRVDAEDLPYAVSTARFIQQLDRLQDKKVGLLNNGETELPDIVITFDDGHISNYELAMPLLLERGLSAYIFVTGEFVAKRPHFCHPSHIKEMADNGLEIGSHGMTHQFFDDLSDDAAERELRQSMEQLAEQSGKPIKSISYPGGRYNKRTLDISRNAGYTELFGSVVGVVKPNELSGKLPLKRVAIRRGTTIEEFDKIINEDTAYYAVAQTKHKAKTLIKRTLGNRLYHGLYTTISAR